MCSITPISTANYGSLPPSHLPSFSLTLPSRTSSIPVNSDTLPSRSHQSTVCRHVDSLKNDDREVLIQSISDVSPVGLTASSDDQPVQPPPTFSDKPSSSSVKHSVTFSSTVDSQHHSTLPDLHSQKQPILKVRQTHGTSTARTLGEEPSVCIIRSLYLIFGSLQLYRFGFH